MTGHHDRVDRILETIDTGLQTAGDASYGPLPDTGICWRCATRPVLDTYSTCGPCREILLADTPPPAPTRQPLQVVTVAVDGATLREAMNGASTSTAALAEAIAAAQAEAGLLELFGGTPTVELIRDLARRYAAATTTKPAVALNHVITVAAASIEVAIAMVDDMEAGAASTATVDETLEASAQRLVCPDWPVERVRDLLHRIAAGYPTAPGADTRAVAVGILNGSVRWAGHLDQLAELFAADDDPPRSPAPAEALDPPVQGLVEVAADRASEDRPADRGRIGELLARYAAMATGNGATVEDLLTGLALLGAGIAGGGDLDELDARISAETRAARRTPGGAAHNRCYVRPEPSSGDQAPDPAT